jgi:GTP pyrophosphokinase
MSPYTNINTKAFIALIEEKYGGESQTLIKKAVDVAYKLSEGYKSGAGESAFDHALAVATITARELNLDADSVAAALLHNILPDHGEASEKVISESFGLDILNLVKGLKKIIEMDTQTVSVNAESFRNLVISLAGDLRVVLIKIADQLDIMRKLENVSPTVVRKFSLETKYLYAPLAHRLGLYNINSELNTLVIKYLEAKAYQEIQQQLEATKDIRDTYIDDFIRPLKKVLDKEGFKYKIKGRTKAIYSIWNKIYNKGVSFDEVYDLFAIRVILDSPPEKEKAHCWQVYSLITGEYPPNTERLRDWISVPKSSGYESLHTTVLGPGNHWIEVQIRTERMDEVAEKGLAAHWKYKGGADTGAMEQWLTDIRNILESDTLSIVDVLDSLQTETVEDEVFVFTPAGDLKRLRKGATLLDFAYNIHSEVGDHCVGGTINGKKVGIRQKLRSGDRINVETSKNQRPKQDWLNFVVSPRARLKIRTTLNEEITREAENGKEIIKRKLKNWKLDFSNENINLMVKELGYKYGKDLYYDIATGKLDPLKVKAVLTKTEEGSHTHDIATPEAAAFEESEHSFSGDTLVIEEHVSNVIYSMAKCCNPVYGDKVFGFITINKGIKIHRNTCPNARDMKTRYPYRLVKATWHKEERTNAFMATLMISGSDEMGIVNKITQIITTEFQMQMSGVKFNSSSGVFKGEVQVYVRNTGHLEMLMENLRKIKGVLQVTRMGN